MNKFAKICGATALAVSMSMPAMAETMNPEGVWQPGNKESRYEISYCGNGAQLCALVKWIDPAFVNDDNRKFINTYLFSELPPSGRNKWRGTISFQGRKISGVVKQLSSEKLSVRACLLFLCEEVLLDRVADK
ncbi:hypothetical protein [Maritalea sp.]|uniref:hypothetical protein n=1 Tax=Maritalea sp. TaxID=2003361 RepID=UPI003EF76AC6